MNNLFSKSLPSLAVDILFIALVVSAVSIYCVRSSASDRLEYAHMANTLDIARMNGTYDVQRVQVQADAQKAYYEYSLKMLYGDPSFSGSSFEDIPKVDMGTGLSLHGAQKYPPDLIPNPKK